MLHLTPSPEELFPDDIHEHARMSSTAIQENFYNKLSAVRVLIVDDNVDLALTIGNIFKHFGCSVAIEHSPFKALQLAETQVFDFCLLDIGLPGMDGYELVSKLRALPNTCSAVFAAHSGYSSAEYIKKSMSSGFSYHFVKPADVSQVLRACAMAGPDVSRF